jgi:hypothetical protein
MGEGTKAAICVLLFVAYFSVMTGFIAYSESRVNEREYACVALGYEGYDSSGYDACRSGENPVILVPYENAFDRVE